jgi:hypothetical protein
MRRSYCPLKGVNTNATWEFDQTFRFAELWLFNEIFVPRITETVIFVPCVIVVSAGTFFVAAERGWLNSNHSCFFFREDLGRMVLLCHRPTRVPHWHKQFTCKNSVINDFGGESRVLTDRKFTFKSSNHYLIRIPKLSASDHWKRGEWMFFSCTKL